MSFFISNNIIKFIIFFQLVLTIGNLKAAQYAIIDSENLITNAQKEEVTKNQERILKNKDTLVSYAFYNVNTSKVRIRLEWESSLQEATENGLSSDQFHLLICVGIFSSQNVVDIFYKNQPALEDVNDLTTCIASLKQNIGSENSIDDLIKNSPEAIQSSLSYLNARPIYEELEKTEANKTKAEQFMAYIFNLVKIALFIIVPIIVILVGWCILSSLNNKRPHTFPIANPKKRLNAPYAATSISQIKK